MISESRAVIFFREFLIYAGAFMILYLFYKSFWVIIPFIPCAAVIRKRRIKSIKEKKAKTLNVQFRDMLSAMSAALRAGYSVENSFDQCREEMEIIYGEDSIICRELDVMSGQLSLGMNAEQIFSDLADRSGLEDIDTFASVFSIAKRTGGNMVEIIGRTAQDIADRVDTEKEIDVLISAKKMEQTIMMMLPVATILYVDFTSPGLLDPLYGNAAGILIMTGCLAVYAGAACIAGKIMKIEV